MKATQHAKREAKQMFRRCLVNGLFDEARARLVVKQFVGTRPKADLALLSCFRRLMALDRAQHTAKIESAQSLSPELQTRLRTDLGRVYGPGLNTSFALNPALIGGMRVQVGSDVYDGSVRARLAAVARRFQPINQPNE